VPQLEETGVLLSQPSLVSQIGAESVMDKAAASGETAFFGLILWMVILRLRPFPKSMLHPSDSKLGRTSRSFLLSVAASGGKCLSGTFKLSA